MSVLELMEVVFDNDNENDTHRSEAKHQCEKDDCDPEFSSMLRCFVFPSKVDGGLPDQVPD